MRIMDRCTQITLKGKRCLKKKLDGECFCFIHKKIAETVKDSCSICYEEIKPDTKYNLKNCTHCFCKECISNWIIQKKNCPMCREPASVADCDYAFRHCAGNGEIVSVKLVKFTISEICEDDRIYLFETINASLSPDHNNWQPYTVSEFDSIKECIRRDFKADSIFSSLFSKVIIGYYKKSSKISNNDILFMFC
jgi:hypothetical protein